jgi:DNA ligase-1
MNDLDMQHGHDWTGEDLAGWYMSEKLDGCRAYWDGAQLWTRGGKVATLPENWSLPAGIALDGELYDGGGCAGRARCASALRYGAKHYTATMRFVAFDAPQETGDWPERIAIAAEVLGGNEHAFATPWRVCDGIDDALGSLEFIQARGGEGLMLRRPGLRYSAGRTRDILKVKSPR